MQRNCEQRHGQGLIARTACRWSCRGVLYSHCVASRHHHLDIGGGTQARPPQNEDGTDGTPEHARLAQGSISTAWQFTAIVLTADGNCTAMRTTWAWTMQVPARARPPLGNGASAALRSPAFHGRSPPNPNIPARESCPCGSRSRGEGHLRELRTHAQRPRYGDCVRIR